jgi:hypothetical protein
VTIDVDGVVVSTGLQVERAFRGFNPHHRKVPSYYPILAHLAETTHMLRVKNRSGNVHDGKASLTFLRDLWTQLEHDAAAGQCGAVSHGWGVFPPRCACVARRAGRRVRHQGALLPLARFAAVHPRAAPVAAGRPRRHRVHRGGRAAPHGAPRCAMAIYRKRVRASGRRRTTNSISSIPTTAHFEYAAVTSNLDLTLANFWHFACGRGNHEKTIAQLKSGLAFHAVPTMTYAANSAWQQLVVLTTIC